MPTLTHQYVWLFKSTTIGIDIGIVDFFCRFDFDQSGGPDARTDRNPDGGFLVIKYSMANIVTAAYLANSARSPTGSDVPLSGCNAPCASQFDVP